MIIHRRALLSRTTGPVLFSFVSPIVFHSENGKVIEGVNNIILKMSSPTKSPGNEKDVQLV
jgi:hypothetical protein